MRQITPRAMLCVWALLSLAAIFYAAHFHYGGRPFAATLITFAFYFAVMLLFAARGVPDFISSHFHSASAHLLGVTSILGYLIYALGTNSFTFPRAAAVTALVFAPLLLAATAQDQQPGAWQDYLTIAGVWVAVKFSPSHWLWPYPGGRLAYVFTVMLCIVTALGTFLLVRRFNSTGNGGVGYSVGWGRRWAFYIAASFLIFAAIAIPLSTAMHFVQFAPRLGEWTSLPFLSLAILCFTAWPEEFLFRGLLQNMLARSTKSETAGWIIASVLFGFSHITNMGFPNWRYVILASIAGLFYGWTWRKTGSIFASAIVHALVDALWHFLFRTL
jgi:uncharacterized protein